jgi:protein-tyrosine phosphatase
MIDLHCHILPGIDDGARDLNVSIDMARAFVADGVSVVACTPHILPGLYENNGPGIRQAVAGLQARLDEAGIPLVLVPGADNHIVPDFVAGLRSGHLLPLANSRYVLVEPPHHVAPQRMDELFFSIQVAGYVPILTHPERLSWIANHYDTVRRLIAAGVWMQITVDSLTGAFGRNPLYWASKMLDEGGVHVLATDAHDTVKRPPRLSQGFEAAAKRVGENEAVNLVLTRPRAVLENVPPTAVPAPLRRAEGSEVRSIDASGDSRAGAAMRAGETTGEAGGSAGLGGLARRLRSFFK